MSINSYVMRKLMTRQGFYSFIGIAVLLIVLFLLAKEYQTEKELTLDRKLTSLHIRELAKLQAKQNHLQHSPNLNDTLTLPSMESSTPSDQEELAQLQRWEKTPTEYRDTLQSPPNN